MILKWVCRRSVENVRGCRTPQLESFMFTTARWEHRGMEESHVQLQQGGEQQGDGYGTAGADVPWDVLEPGEESRREDSSGQSSVSLSVSDCPCRLTEYEVTAIALLRPATSLDISPPVWLDSEHSLETSSPSSCPTCPSTSSWCSAPLRPAWRWRHSTLSTLHVRSVRKKGCEVLIHFPRRDQRPAAQQRDQVHRDLQSAPGQGEGGQRRVECSNHCGGRHQQLQTPQLQGAGQL